MIPYNKLMLNGTVMHGEVVEVGPKGVVINGRESPINFDYLVLATGSSYAFPGRLFLSFSFPPLTFFPFKARLLFPHVMLQWINTPRLRMCYKRSRKC